MFTGDNSEWRCDYCGMKFTGDMIGGVTAPIDKSVGFLEQNPVRHYLFN